MPAINPNNYNIDFFHSYNFGDITDSSYVEYLLGQNLLNLPDELIDGAAGNFLSMWTYERGLEKTINYSQIENPGDVDEWMTEGNVPVNLNDIRTNIILKDNEYGPAVYQAYNCPQLEDPEETGFIQYPTSTGGNVVTNILGETLDAVGLGGLNAFLIDFPSELSEIANERRLTELKNRVKQNLINETVGRINLDPLGLLAGQPLFGKDYKITKPAKGIPIPGLGALTDLTDINLLALRKNPLPDGAFDWDQPMRDPFSVSTIDITKKLLKYTGKGTQDLLFNSLAPNKYGPIIEGKKFDRKLGRRSKDANQPPQKLGYLAFGNDEKFEISKKAQRRRDDDLKQHSKTAKQLASTIPQNVTQNVNLKEVEVVGVSKARDSRPDIPITPTESENPSVDTLTTNEKLKFQGFEFEAYGQELDHNLNSEKRLEDDGHIFSWDPSVSFHRITPRFTELGSFDGTWTTNDGVLVKGDNSGHEPGPQVWELDLYWQERIDSVDTPKRGLLSYTQKIIDKSTNVAGTPGRFIGLPNSDQNYDEKSGDRRHITMSQGSLVKETKENKYYCRSWSVRNAYNRYNDLIRHDELWRNTQPGTIKKEKSDTNTKLGQFTTLRSPGIPKIAWERDGEIEKKIMALQGLTVDKNLVIPYMFSIENLAWKDSPHFRKLPQCEKGPFGGRIMWFPPYNISFTDNTSVNWDTTSFIGRAEPIYTYNNTERTGTLTFSIIVDHPSVVNKLKEEAFYGTTTTNSDGEKVFTPAENNLETFFAGCDGNTTKNIVREAFKEFIPAEEEKIPEPVEEKVEEITFEIPEVIDGLSFYFKNAQLSTSKDSDTYDHYDYIATNSSCPGGKLTSGKDAPHDLSTYNVQGRCVDYNYEKVEYTYIDNPKLYKTGTLTLYGACWGAEICGTSKLNAVAELGEDEKNNIIPLGYTQEDLVEIPIGSTNSVGEELAALPCGGGSNYAKWGPNAALGFNALWWSGSGQGYKSQNFCKECLPLTGSTNETISCPAGYTLSGTSICYSASTTCPTGYTLSAGVCYSGTTTASSITTIVTTSATTTPIETVDASKLGFEMSRPGYNQRFFGTGSSQFPVAPSIPYSHDNISPKLKLPIDVEGVFTVTGSGEGIAGAGISQLIEFLTTTPEGKGYQINIVGNASALGNKGYNDPLSEDRAQAVRAWMIEQMKKCEDAHSKDGVKFSIQGIGSVKLYKETKYDKPVSKAKGNKRWTLDFKGESQATGAGNDSVVGSGSRKSSSQAAQFTPTPSRAHPGDTENLCQLQSRRVDISLTPNAKLLKPYMDAFNKKNKENIQGINEDLQKEFEAKKAVARAKAESEKQKALDLAKSFINECDYFLKIKEEDSFLYGNIKDKLRNFHPAFHSITPEGFNSRITFLQQCGRQGPSFIDPKQPQNTAFGRPPVCILRIGDFYNTKIIIDTINFTFDPLQWDLNPEGIGVQPMLCSVDLNFKFIGGSTLQGPLSALQNAVSYNFFANTAIYMPLEKILEKRKTFKLTGTDVIDGIAGYEETGEKEVDTGYFYGPFAGQEEFNDAIGVNKDKESKAISLPEDGTVGEAQEAQESEEAASQGEGGNDGGPPVTGSGSGCVDETLLSEEQKTFSLTQESTPDKVKADPDKYDGYYCNDSPPMIHAGETTWVLKISDINESEDDLTQDGEENGGDTDGTEIGAPNTTDKDGNKVFNPPNSVRYKPNSIYENDFGNIVTDGDYLNFEKIGDKGSYSSNLKPPNKIRQIFPQWVYGDLNLDISFDWEIGSNHVSYYKGLGGGSGSGGGSNNAVVWDHAYSDEAGSTVYNQTEKNPESYSFGQQYHTISTVDDNNTPTAAHGTKLFAYNILEEVTGYRNWDEWKEAYGNGDDFIIESMEDEIEKQGYSDWKLNFHIQVKEIIKLTDEDIINGKTRGVVGGSIRLNGQINAEGLEAIKATLT